jgi:ribonuclease Z
MLPARMLSLFGTRILFHCLADGMTFDILGRKTVFFDTRSKKTLQYGVKVTLKNDKTITYLGDEPYREECAVYAEEADYLMHEALCMERDEAKYHPHKIQHSTVKDAAECAERLGVKNLILFHTEDKQLATRKHHYTAEAEAYFPGNVYVPDDLDVIIL